MTTEIRSAASNPQTAEMHFKQATVLDPQLIEARVRLGRVRTLLRRADEAVPDLEAAAIASRDPAVRYYAVLFLGEAEQARGDVDRARAAYQRAATLYPTSQSPHLALSLLAREAGDRETAWFSLQHFLNVPPAAGRRPDPWWMYHLGSGRQLNTLVEKLWTALPAPQPQ